MKQRCKETLAKAYLFIDGEVLSESERLEIQLHLEECAPCYQRFGVQQQVVMLIESLKGSACCPDALKARVAKLLDQP